MPRYWGKFPNLGFPLWPTHPHSVGCVCTFFGSILELFNHTNSLQWLPQKG